MRSSHTSVGAAAILLLGLHGCDEFGRSYVECQQDTDCPMVMGEQLLCTSDNLCVSGTRYDLLCPSQQQYPQFPLLTSIPIGALLHLSAVPQPETLPLQALQLGVDEVNSQLVSSGRQLVLHVCDISQQAPSQPAVNVDLRKAYDFLVHTRNVVAVLGPTLSSEVLQLAPLLRANQVPIISPSASASAISALPQPSFVFSTYPSTRIEGPCLAAQVAKTKGPALGLAYSDETYGFGYLHDFLMAWQDPKGLNMPMPVVAQGFLSQNDAARQAATTFLLQKEQTLDNVVLLSLAQDLAPLVKDLGTLPSSKKIFLSHGGQGPALLKLSDEMHPDHLDRVSVVSGGLAKDFQSLALATFKIRYKNRFEVDPTTAFYVTYIYDAFYAAAIAIGSLPDIPTGPMVAQTLKNITIEGSTSLTVSAGQPTYLKAVACLQRGPLNLQGTTGTVGFTNTGERQFSQFVEWKISQPAPAAFSAVQLTDTPCVLGPPESLDLCPD